MNKDSKIYVTAKDGMVGSAIIRELLKQGYSNIITRSKNQLDLLNKEKVKEFLSYEKPDYIFLCSAKVGGIVANNTYPVDFLYDNMMIEFNVIKSAYECGINNLMFFGSSCIYPKFCDIPIKESYLMTGSLESTNEAYALAKISGIKLCQAYNKQYGTKYITVMPCSLYGEGDNFHPANSHLIPALIQKIHNAKKNNLDSVELWGTGNPLREFLYIDDLANACIFLMKRHLTLENDIINIGSGIDYTIKNIANLIKYMIGYEGEIKFDTTKPDGTFRKLIDSNIIKRLGWKYQISLRDGLEKIYKFWLTKE